MKKIIITLIVSLGLSLTNITFATQPVTAGPECEFVGKIVKSVSWNTPQDYVGYDNNFILQVKIATTSDVFKSNLYPSFSCDKIDSLILNISTDHRLEINGSHLDKKDYWSERKISGRIHIDLDNIGNPTKTGRFTSWYSLGRLQDNDVRKVELLYPKTGDTLIKNKFYTIKWIPDFYDIRLQGTNIIAQAYLINTKDGSEIPLSYGLIFSQEHFEAQSMISIKASEYSKYQILPGKYKFGVKFSDLIPAKPCGVAIEPTESPCIYGKRVDYGVIAEAESAGDITIIEPTINSSAESHVYTYTVPQLLNATSSIDGKNDNPLSISTNNETFLIHAWLWFVNLFK